MSQSWPPKHPQKQQLNIDVTQGLKTSLRRAYTVQRLATPDTKQITAVVFRLVHRRNRVVCYTAKYFYEQGHEPFLRRLW